MEELQYLCVIDSTSTQLRCIRKGDRKKLAKRDAGSENDISWVEEIWVSSYNFWALG